MCILLGYCVHPYMISEGRYRVGLGASWAQGNFVLVSRSQERREEHAAGAPVGWPAVSWGERGDASWVSEDSGGGECPRGRLERTAEAARARVPRVGVAGVPGKATAIVQEASDEARKLAGCAGRRSGVTEPCPCRARRVGWCSPERMQTESPTRDAMTPGEP